MFEKSEILLNLLNNPVLCVIIGALMAGFMSLVIEYLRHREQRSIELERKKEEFFIQLVEYITSLYDQVLLVKDPVTWRKTNVPKELLEKFQKMLPKFLLYGNDRIRQPFLSLVKNLLIGMPCTKEFNYFCKLLSFELNTNLKKSSTIKYYLFIIKYWHFSYKTEINNEKKNFCIKLLFNVFNMLYKYRENKTVIPLYVNYLDDFLKQNKQNINSSFIKNIEDCLKQINENPSPENLKKSLDKLAPHFWEEVQKHPDFKKY